MSTEKADCGVILSQAERIHDSGGGETVGGGPLHGVGRGGGGRVLNHCRAGGVSRVVIRVRDVERLRLQGRPGHCEISRGCCGRACWWRLYGRLPDLLRNAK